MTQSHLAERMEGVIRTYILSCKAGYGFAALRAWNEHRALVPQIHSLDGLGAPRTELLPFVL